MKTTVVPAQITSVEDRITGNLSFSQLLLMIVPVFVSAALFVLLPPFTSYRPYKLIISVLLAAVCIILAIRIKGRLVVEWIGLLSRYNLRPRYYVFNKNSLSSRKIEKIQKEPKKLENKVPTKFLPKQALVFNTGEVMNFEDRLKNPEANFHFSTNKKGGLRVHIKEVK